MAITESAAPALHRAGLGNESKAAARKLKVVETTVVQPPEPAGASGRDGMNPEGRYARFGEGGATSVSVPQVETAPRKRKPGKR